ncbi:MAG: zf-HC2 domain-containing protein [Chitinivibrionia bacterium]|nr:zf-HC2 domain-containing protein [Chitinivibrionia bacterium]
MALCKNSLEKISAYVDRELSRSEAEALEAHLSACGLCRKVLRATRMEKDLLKHTYSPMKAPARLAKRIKADIREKSTTVGFYAYDISHDAYLIESLPQRPFDIVSASIQETAAFLSKFVGFPVHVPDLAYAGFGMKGGRLWHTVARISALIVYEDASGNAVSLFEIKKERVRRSGATEVVADNKSFYLGKAYGYNGVVWLQRDVAFGLVGGLPHDKLLEIARAAAANLEQ